MLKTITSIILAFAIMFSLSSKDIYKNDISNRLIIQGIGIDEEKDGTYTLTIQAINTTTHTSSVSDSGDETVKIYKVHGPTIYTAIKSITEYEGKIPMYSQNRIIVIGNKIATKGIDGIVDFFSRDADIGPSVFIAMTKNRAEEILSMKVKGEVVARNIDFILKSSKFESRIYSLRLYELINLYKEDMCSFAMPVISQALKEEGSSVEITETAMFKNGKFLSFIDRDETTFYNMINNSFKGGKISFPIEMDEKVSLNIADFKMCRKVDIQNNYPKYKIAIDIKADVAEIYNGINNQTDEKKLNIIKDYGEKHIENKITNLTEKLYGSYCVDAPELIRMVNSKYPKYYRENKNNLNSIVNNSSFTIEVNIKLRRVGQDYVVSS